MTDNRWSSAHTRATTLFQFLNDFTLGMAQGSHAQFTHFTLKFPLKEVSFFGKHTVASEATEAAKRQRNRQSEAAQAT